jgi:DNA-binding transcriptional ArsR family regulator
MIPPVAAVTDSDLDAVFAALADPTRRRLFTRLVRGGPRSATELARDEPMSRQAVVHHLQRLADAGLADARRRGREVRWSACKEPLSLAAGWIRIAGGGP